MNLKDLMQSEYEAMAAMEIPMPDTFERAMAFIRTKLTKKRIYGYRERNISGMY